MSRTGSAAFRDRSLADATFPYVFLDATYGKARVGRRVVSQAVVIATGGRCDPNREVLGFDVGDSENGAFWTAFLRSLKARGLAGVQLVISDAHEGLKTAIGSVLLGSSWQDEMVVGLWTRARGAGPTVLVLHGNGEDGDSLGPVIDDLAHDHRVIAPDSRAHGRSPRGTGPLTIARMADDTAAVLRDLGTGPVHVVGFSDGGNIGLMLALLHPDLVRTLIVYGANVDPAGMTLSSRTAVTARGSVLRLAARISPGLRVRAKVVDLMVRQPRIPLHALTRIVVPVLVAAGEHDVIRPAHTAAIAAHLPQGRTHIEQGVGHGWPLASPEGFARLVRERLREA